MSNRGLTLVPLAQIASSNQISSLPNAFLPLPQKREGRGNIIYLISFPEDSFHVWAIEAFVSWQAAHLH